MSIKYFPNRVFKGSVPAIDRVMAKRQPIVVRGHQDINSTALDVVISANSDWQVNSIKLTFSNATSRDYSVSILGGVKVLKNLNDYLWFQTPNSLWQQITLNPGFYTGDDLAAELENELNANNTFANALSLTFSVAYDNELGSFLVAPTTGTVKYLQVAPVRLPLRDSIAGHLFGLTTTTVGFEANVSSDVSVFGLDQEAWIIKEAASVVTSDFSDDIHILSLDQALHIVTNTANTAIDYEVCYEEIV